MATEEKSNVYQLEHIEHSTGGSSDAVHENAAGLAIALEEGKDTGLAAAHLCTEEDSKRILRKTDIYMLSLLCMVYFLQSCDKGIIGLTAVYGLKTDAHLVGNDYSNLGNIGYYAQLGFQPLAAWLVVKLRYRQVLPFIITAWGISVVSFSRYITVKLQSPTNTTSRLLVSVVRRTTAVSWPLVSFSAPSKQWLSPSSPSSQSRFTADPNKHSEWPVGIPVMV